MANIKFTRRMRSTHVGDGTAPSPETNHVTRNESETAGACDEGCDFDSDSGVFMTDSEDEGEGEGADEDDDAVVEMRLDVSAAETSPPRRRHKNTNRDDINFMEECEALTHSHRARVFVFGTQHEHTDIHGRSEEESETFLRMSDIMGMGNVVNMLRKHIQFPLMNHFLYKGHRFTSHYLCVCGLEGSGKRTVVRAFAKHHRINLIEVQRFWNTPALMEAIVRGALRLAPCIVYFDDCDHHFMELHDPTVWWRQISCFCDPVFREAPDCEVWLVIGSRHNPVRFAGDMQLRLANNFVVAHPPDTESKAKYMRNTCNEFWGRPWTDDAHRAFLGKVCAHYSNCATYSTIRDFLYQMYHECVYEAGSADENAFRALPPGSPKLMPSQAMMDRMLNALASNQLLASERNKQDFDALCNARTCTL